MVRRICTGFPLALGVAILLLWRASLSAIGPATWNPGDVVAGVGSGTYNVYDGTTLALKDQLTVPAYANSFTTGCAFTPGVDKLYTTYFTANRVVVFDVASPHAILNDFSTTSPPGSGDATSFNESIAFHPNGDYYVGHAGNTTPGTFKIQKYNSVDVWQQSYANGSEVQGSDWIDLSSDGHTIFYTSEGDKILRFDTATNTQLADFATIPPIPGVRRAFALRLLPPGDGTGGLLVADSENIKRLDAAGNIVDTYDVAGENSWFSLNRDPDGVSFWSGDQITGHIYKFNIATHAVTGPINTGAINGNLAGICVMAELTSNAGTAFVIGDDEPHAIGDVVNFWGSQWSKNNQVTGVYNPGSAAFKGFANVSDNVCGGTWTTRPGNSPPPPDSIPSDITVIVTSSVTKNGPNIGGPIVQMVTVHTDGKYGPSPGHPGGGVVTGIICP